MAIAGPVVSLVIGALAYLILRFAGAGLSPEIQGVLLALAYYNVALGVFNLIPGFPLDGGRIFRSIVWAITHNFREATSIATAVGHFFGYLFIFVGLVLAFLGGDFLGGIWLVFIGWWLNSAAEVSQQQVQLESQLRGVQVSRVMRARPIEVPADTTLADFIEHYVLAQNVRAAPVVGPEDRLVGLVTLGEARSVPRDRWGTTTVSQVMLPAERLTIANPDEPLIQAVRDLGKDDINQLPVVDHGTLVGVLTRSDVIRYLQVRQELGGKTAA
jgi:CBS domain-containing protein